MNTYTTCTCAQEGNISCNEEKKWEFISLTHWDRVAHICVSKLTVIGSDNGLSPGRRQVIIGTNAGIVLIGPLGRNFNEILIEIHTFSFNKTQSKMSSAKRPPFCLGLNVLSIQRLWNDKKHTHKTKQKHTFSPLALPPRKYGSIHDDATRQLYLVYNISKVRSEQSWDIVVDIPDNTDWLMGVCVTSRGTFKSMGDYLKCHAPHLAKLSQRRPNCN